MKNKKSFNLHKDCYLPDLHEQLFSDMQLQFLKRECIKIRKLLEKASNEKAADYFLDSFPRGKCGLTCRVLGPWLISMFPDYRFEYVCGFRGEQSHAWIEARGLIIDITADQFDDISDKVIVGYDHKIHDTFENKTYRPLSMEDIKEYPESRIFIYLTNNNFF